MGQLNMNKENSGRTVLGDKKNVQDEREKGQLLLKKPEPAGGGVIIISDGQRWQGQHAPAAPPRHVKAAQISKLTQAAGQAADNRALAQITADFVKVLQSSNSRTLTREGFAFLDALHKQLADPSVFIVPLRSSKTRSSRSQQQVLQQQQQQQQYRRRQEKVPAEEVAHERRGRLNVLRTSLAEARDNKSLAQLIADFGTLVDGAAGRQLTKDGVAFLESMADRLLVVRV